MTDKDKSSGKTATLKGKFSRFRKAVRAVHVLPTKKGWEVFRIGSMPKGFATKEKALQAASEAAERHKIQVLIHESGHADKVRH